MEINNIEVHNLEIISLEDFYETDNPNVYIKDNGDKAILKDLDTCLVFRLKDQ